MRWLLWMLIFLGIAPVNAADELCNPTAIADRQTLELYLRPRIRKLETNAKLGEPLEVPLAVFLERPVLDIGTGSRLDYSDALDQGQVIRYKMEPLTQKVDGATYTLEANRFQFQSRYLRRPVDASRFRTFIGVDQLPLLAEAGRHAVEVETVLLFQADWNDRSGTYKGVLRPDNQNRTCRLPEILVRLTIAPQVAVELKPKALELTPSSSTSPIIDEVDVWLSSNMSRWQLYLTGDVLKQAREKEQIEADHIFVREKGEKQWHSLEQSYVVAQGRSGAKRKVATIEMFIASEQETPPGDYQGNLHWLVDTK